MTRLSLHLLARMERKDLAKVLEYDFAVAVSEYARNAGWQVSYTRKSGYKDASGKWRGLSPMGEPDLRMARYRGGDDWRVLFVELKRERGVLRPDQARWLHALGPYGRLWRPRDAAQIMETLG